MKHEPDSGFLLKGGRPVVLCVDDEEAVLSSLSRTLKGEPYNLLSTRHPEEALEWLRHHRVQVLVADQRMPGMTGLELLRSTLAVSPRTKRVMLTAHADIQLIATATLDARVHHFLTKPWDEERLKETLRSLLPGLETPSEKVSGAMPTHALSTAPAGDQGGMTIRVNCKGMAAGEVLEQIDSARLGLMQTHDDLQVVLEDLMSLDDSVVALLTQLVRAIFKSGSRVSLCLNLRRSHFGTGGG